MMELSKVLKPGTDCELMINEKRGMAIETR